jgi:hypothetical protein
LPGEKEEMNVPHILKDGADSVGVRGAAIRVYVNIGMFSEYWLTRHDRLLGLKRQKPFEIPYSREHSVFWRATEERLDNIAAFFRKLKSFRLADTPGGQAYITADSAVMMRGKEVFAESCAACHSSKQPPENIDPRSAEGKAWFRAAVMSPDFLENNFLSNDRRYPLITVKTNSARAFASNAKSGHIWDNFSSLTYKELSLPMNWNFSTHLIKPIPSNSDRKTKMLAPVTIGLHPSSASGVRHRSCTITCWENLPAIPLWQVAWQPLTMRWKNCFGPKNG